MATPLPNLPAAFYALENQQYLIFATGFANLIASNHTTHNITFSFYRIHS